MKFRAQIVEAASMRQFSSIISTLSKLSKTCVLRICTDRLYFIVPEEHAVPCKVSVWCVLHRNEFFASYIMDGETEKNEIYLEFSSDMLASSLSSLRGGANNVISLKIKLTDKGTPCITLELELASQNNTQLCIHDVPVLVTLSRDWLDFQEPEVTYDASVKIPNAKILKNIVDKLKKIGNKVTVITTTEGSFSLLVKATTANIETHFKDLVVKKLNQSSTDDKFSVCVDIRKMSHFLTCESINASVMVCDIVIDHMLHLELSNTGFQLNYYLMAIDD